MRREIRLKRDNPRYVFKRVDNMDPDLYFCSDAVHRHIKLPRHINDIIVVVSSTEGDFTLRLADDGLGYIDGVKEYIMLDSRKALRDLYHTGYRYLSVEYEE